MTTNKNTKTGISILIILAAFSFSGFQDHFTQINKHMANVPIYMPYNEMRTPIEMGSITGLSQPGKIYFKDQYIFINEIGKGLHVYDNTNPSSPVNLAFIEIPGNVDIAIKGDILYADNFTDLIVMDISDPTDAKFIERFNDVFPYSLPPYDESYPRAEIDRSIGVVVGWKLEESETICHDADCETQFPVSIGFATWDMQTFTVSSFSPNMGIGARGTGVGGSMARFALNGDYLYTVSETDLYVFDLQTPRSPILGDKIDIGMNIETIFPYGDNLFIGSQTGMFIYDVSSPFSPSFISEFTHMRSCDPVVVEGDYAYVTMRSGTSCGGWTNELNVVDISTLSNPTLVRSISMSNPHGLGIDGDKLFVCDGTSGLRIYSAANPSSIKLLETKSDINALDLILYNNLMMMIGKDGLYQYDYSDIENLEFLSVIPVN